MGMAYAWLARVLIYTFLSTKPIVPSIFVPYIMKKNKKNCIWNVNDVHIEGFV